jgi:hypothetical protein
LQGLEFNEALFQKFNPAREREKTSSTKGGRRQTFTALPGVVTGHFSILISKFVAGPVLHSHYFAGETGRGDVAIIRPTAPVTNPSDIPTEGSMQGTTEQQPVLETSTKKSKMSKDAKRRGTFG